MSQQHVPALDGVRGTAVLIVFLYHYGGGSRSSNPVLHAFGWLIEGSWAGVSLFFVLSGFLISGILWDARGTNWRRNFYMRRCLRIFPLYYASLFIVLIAAAVAGHGLRHLWIYAVYLQNFYNVRDTGPLLLSHFWSLAVEEQFYLLWPFLLMRTKNIDQAKKLCVGVFLLALGFRLFWHTPAAYMSILGRCGELAVGAYLALCFRQPDAWKKIQRAAPLTALAALGGFFAIGAVNKTLHIESRTMATVGLSVIALFFGMFVALALGSGWINRTMTFSGLRRLGTVSYGFYVFHVMFLPQTRWLAGHIASGRTEQIVTFVLGAVLSYALASVSYRFFELPFLKLRKRFREDHLPVGLVIGPHDAHTNAVSGSIT